MRILFSVNDARATLFVNNTKVFEVARQDIESRCAEATGSDAETWWPENCLSLVPATGVSLVNQDNVWHAKHAPESPRGDSSISVIQNYYSRRRKMIGDVPRETAYPTKDGRMIVEDLQAFGKTTPYNIKRFDVFVGALNGSDILAMHECDTLEWKKLEQIQDGVRTQAALNARALTYGHVALAILSTMLTGVVMFAIYVTLRHCMYGQAFLYKTEPESEIVQSVKGAAAKVQEEFEESISLWTMRYLDTVMEENYAKFVFERDQKMVAYSFMLLIIPYTLYGKGILAFVSPRRPWALATDLN